MPHAEHSLVVSAPVSDVYVFLSDPTNDVGWRSGVREIGLTSGAPRIVGAKYRQRVAGPFGRTISADIELTALEPDRLIAFRGISGPARPQGSYELTPVEGGTRVRFSLSYEPHGFARLMSRMIQKTMDGEVARLDHLQAAMERKGSAASPTT